jgi:hypothetical protein
MTFVSPLLLSFAQTKIAAAARMSCFARMTFLISFSSGEIRDKYVYLSFSRQHKNVHVFLIEAVNGFGCLAEFNR